MTNYPTPTDDADAFVAGMESAHKPKGNAGSVLLTVVDDRICVDLHGAPFVSLTASEAEDIATLMHTLAASARGQRFEIVDEVT